MGLSRMLVAPGARTHSPAGWRSGVASALSVVVGQPALWLLGALGFLLRGGILLLTAAIVVVPTPVEWRLLIGENLGSSGLAPGFIGLLFVGGLALVAVLLGALACLAGAELAAFERLAADGEAADDRRERWAVPSGSARQQLLAALFVVQLLTVAALALASLPLAGAIVSQAYEEIVRPGLGGTIYLRVLAGVREPLFVFIAALVAIEMISAIATRRLLVRSFSRAATGQPMTAGQLLRAVPLAILGALFQPLRRPLPTLATLVAGWLALLIALVPVGWALSVGWQQVRGAYLGDGLHDLQALVGIGLITLLLAGIWLASLLLLGFVSAVRAALWSVDALRR